jgi:CDP-diacylglycerol--glycerol-3-phosphate 3-phosphatidyltransferase
MTIEFNIPTNLTLLRIALIPLLTAIFYVPWEYSNLVCTLIFMFAGLTDWLDAILQKNAAGNAFRRFLDPVADKLMVAIVLVLIVQQQATPYSRFRRYHYRQEITIASLREWMAEIGQRAKSGFSIRQVENHCANAVNHAAAIS